MQVDGNVSTAKGKSERRSPRRPRDLQLRQASEKLRLRQFHGEGFVNTYTEGQSLVFETSEIENIPEGWRARETYKQLTADSWQETFELAAPGKEFAVYSSSTFKRVK
ncbi:MAG TPA: hypothetical protein VEU30_14180 [Thermoanaerobaculia bacterium]|nr:hypothetical protein [Thermoanaerobaculia bacterium]